MSQAKLSALTLAVRAYCGDKKAALVTMIDELESAISNAFKHGNTKPLRETHANCMASVANLDKPEKSAFFVIAEHVKPLTEIRVLPKETAKADADKLVSDTFRKAKDALTVALAKHDEARKAEAKANKATKEAEQAEAKAKKEAEQEAEKAEAVAAAIAGRHFTMADVMAFIASAEPAEVTAIIAAAEKEAAKYQAIKDEETARRNAAKLAAAGATAIARAMDKAAEQHNNGVIMATLPAAPEGLPKAKVTRKTIKAKGAVAVAA